MEEFLDGEASDENCDERDSESSSRAHVQKKPKKSSEPIIISDDEDTPKALTTSAEEDLCPICLQSFDTETFVDGCMHRFCLFCILQWIEVTPSCPLCKAVIRELIHDVTDDLQFRKIKVSEFMKSRTSSDHSAEQFPSLDHRRRKRIYNLNLRAHLPSTASSAFILSPKTITSSLWDSRIGPWIEREAQSILEESDVSLVLTVLRSLLFKYPLDAIEFTKEIDGFFGASAAQTFVHELRTFAAARCDLRAYDRLVTYSPPPSSSSSSSARIHTSPSVSSSLPLPIASRPSTMYDLRSSQSDVIDLTTMSDEKRKVG